MKHTPDSGMRPSFTNSAKSALRRQSPSVPARVGSGQARFPSLTGTQPLLRPWQAPMRWLPRQHQILYDAAVLSGVASRTPNVPTLPKACLPDYDARHAPSESLHTQTVSQWRCASLHRWSVCSTRTISSLTSAPPPVLLTGRIAFCLSRCAQSVSHWCRMPLHSRSMH